MKRLILCLLVTIAAFGDLEEDRTFYKEQGYVWIRGWKNTSNHPRRALFFTFNRLSDD